MRAVLQHKPGAADTLYIGNIDRPFAGRSMLLIKVIFSALNRADILQREGKYPPPAGVSPVPGLELSGIVEAVGEGVTDWKQGDKVFALVSGGAHAEYAIVHQEMALRVPAEMSFEQCAAIPEVFLTAYQSLVWLGNLKQNEKVLLHAGGSGVGTAAIQLVKALGARCFVTASSSKHRICLKLGAEAAFDYKQEAFWATLKSDTGGVDLIIDPVGGSYFAENLNLLKTDGRLVMLAAMGGVKSDQANIGQIVFKRLQVLGTTLRSRSIEYQIKLTHEFWNWAENEFVSGRLKPVIDRVFELDQVAEAHAYLESNLSTGKVLLKIA